MPQSLRSHFTELFTELDKADVKQRLNIDTYNVRVTSLEEVFNTLGEEELSKESKDTASSNELDQNDRMLD